MNYPNLKQKLKNVTWIKKNLMYANNILKVNNFKNTNKKKSKNLLKNIYIIIIQNKKCKHTILGRGSY